MDETRFNTDYEYFHYTELTERAQREIDLTRQLLDLRPHASILDLACGCGRIANSLAQCGYKVTGLDLSPAYIEQARSNAAAAGIEADYVQGDMRELSWTEDFDAVVCWFNSYGYFDDDDNLRVLAQAQRALKKGGKLLLELRNRERSVNPSQQASVKERNSNYLISLESYDVLTGRLNVERVVFRDGQVRRLRFFLRLFSYPELAMWLRESGFKRIKGYDQEGYPLAVDSQRMLVVAEKGG